MRIRMNYYTDPEILHMDPNPDPGILHTDPNPDPGILHTDPRKKFLFQFFPTKFK